jgi:dienelactone hydrolase
MAEMIAWILHSFFFARLVSLARSFGKCRATFKPKEKKMPAKTFIQARPRISLGLLFASAFLLAACQSTRTDLPKGMTPVMATWFEATHSLPPSKTKSGTEENFRAKFGDPSWRKQVGELLKNPEAKLPAVLYLHGCAGIRNNAYRYQELLNSEGYVVFMPDSFKRGRLKCRAEGTLSYRVGMRPQEVKYALSRIRKIPWIDQNRVILMGHSEGGNTTDNWSQRGFAAHIISGSACTLVFGFPAAPEGIPVLAMVGENDETRPGLSCTVRRTIGGSKSIIIPGAGHVISQFPETQEAIKRFLRECCSASTSRK